MKNKKASIANQIAVVIMLVVVAAIIYAAFKIPDLYNFKLERKKQGIFAETSNINNDLIILNYLRSNAGDEDLTSLLITSYVTKDFKIFETTFSNLIDIYNKDTKLWMELNSKRLLSTKVPFGEIKEFKVLIPLPLESSDEIIEMRLHVETER